MRLLRLLPPSKNITDQRAGDLDINGFHDASDSWYLRRVRPTIEGTLFGKYDFRFTPDFAGGTATVVDAYIDARFDPAFKVRIGKFKSFVGLERLQSAYDITDPVHHAKGIIQPILKHIAMHRDAHITIRQNGIRDIASFYKFDVVRTL